MSIYIPDEDFTDKVMEKVQNIHSRRQQHLIVTEKLIGGLPVRALLSLAATVCGVWNLARVYLVLLSPVICK